MSDSNDKSVSLVNLGSLTKPVDTATKGLVDGAGAFLGKICLPAAEEFGILLRERVSYWRALNLAKVLKKTEGKLKAEYREVSPKLILPIIDGASLEEDEELQDLWANLLSSALDPNFKGTIRSAYVDIIKQLEVIDVHILNTIYRKYKESVGGQEPVEDGHVSPTEYPVDGDDILEAFKLESGVYESSIDNLLRVRCVVSYVKETEINVDSGRGNWWDFGSRSRLQGGRRFYSGGWGGESHHVTYDYRYRAVSLTSLGVNFIEACTSEVSNSERKPSPPPPPTDV